MATDAQLTARSAHARRLNHQRWHDGPLDTCDRCAPKPATTGGGMG